MRPLSRPTTPHGTPEEPGDAAWQALLAFSRSPPGTLGAPDLAAADHPLTELYAPLLRIAPTCAVAHLGQSLDGRIASETGDSYYVTGREDILHNHRMRALFDAVLVGAGTVRHDDPQLTVRLCPGDNPVRIVIDTERRLDTRYRVFRGREAPTLLLTAADRADGACHGEAEVIGLPRRGEGLDPERVRALLAQRGLSRLFIEGGGITVSRFLAAGCLDRLQVTVAPLIIGSGAPALTIPGARRLSEGLRPPVRRFDLGNDVMFECILVASDDTRE